MMDNHFFTPKGGEAITVHVPAGDRYRVKGEGDWKTGPGTVVLRGYQVLEMRRASRKEGAPQ